MIDVRKYSEVVNGIAKRFPETVEQIEIVFSISDWCTAHKITDNSPFSPGRCFTNNTTGKHLILLSEFVSDDERQSILEAMVFRGSTRTDVETLENDDLLFVKHLVLHECAHAIHPEFSELDCDTWAFKELKDEKV
jgi:hypothetical protein